MADIRDLVHATAETDAALAVVDTLMGRIEEGGNPAEGLVLACGLRAVACAVRELGVRVDYVSHNIGGRPGSW